MRKTFIVTVVVSFAFLLISCGSSEPWPVQVIGAPADLVPITGEWSGTYDSFATGRTGSITFHLTENPKGAHGDVLMIPKQEVIRGNEEPRRHPEPLLGPSVLSIEFVRIAAGEISGKIAPYPDPEVSGATLETHFAGHLDGEWIEGTFVTYSDHGVSPRRGTWRVHRKPAA
ncbi:MAG TPA: hypothetical protein VE974_20240 [Thermoanaerobaculia bacterium]|nr:hypothetical protein [Thermoanaerobaculia bacterium]